MNEISPQLRVIALVVHRPHELGLEIVSVRNFEIVSIRIFEIVSVYLESSICITTSGAACKEIDDDDDGDDDDDHHHHNDYLSTLEPRLPVNGEGEEGVPGNSTNPTQHVVGRRVPDQKKQRL